VLEILEARRRIAKYIRRTPLAHSHWLSDASGGHVSLKLECLQVAGSFKARGAFNAVMVRLERSANAPRQFVTASAGGHGRALAAAAEAFNVPLVVFTPMDAPKTKLEAIRRHGADLRPIARDYDEAEPMAKAFAAETGAEFISAYSDADVIAGAGTVALEIFEDAPETDLVTAGIGGGGLVSGLAMVAKALGRQCEVVGIELDVAHAFQTSVAAGRLVTIAAGASLAEGLGGNPDPETITFPIIQRLVDRIVTVSEQSLASATAAIVEHEHVVVEVSGAAAAAAIVSGRLDVRGRKVAALVTGSNIDRARLAELLR